MTGGSPGAAAVAATSRATSWSIRGATLSLDRPLVMGILNATPDSFSDAGELGTVAAAVERGVRMIEEGADLLDVGGESTRPGARDVPAAEQLDRVLPVVEALVREGAAAISVDTRSAEVARAALAAGAAVVNDVSAFGDPAMPAVVRDAGAGVVLMHMRGTPETMQSRAVYGDVVAEVLGELSAAAAAALAAGIPEARVALDPGIGFAKTAAHNVALLARLDRFADLGFPLLVGPSRKSFIGHILGGLPPRERGHGTVATCVTSLLAGARIFRVHDVAPARQALDVAEAIRRGELSQR